MSGMLAAPPARASREPPPPKEAPGEPPGRAEAAPARPAPLPDLEGAGAFVLCLQAAMLARASLAEAAGALATEIAQDLHCERVSVGLAGRGSVRLVAASGGRVIEPRSPAGRAIAAAMDEAFDQQATLIHPAPAPALPFIIAAQQRLAAGGGAVCSIPLMSGERIAGILTLERATGPFRDWEVARAEDAACFAGPLLELKQQAQRGWLARLGATLATGGGRLAGPGGGLARLAVAGAAALVAAAALVPVPWRIGAPARLEGAVQRAIVAPADGYLRQANVRAGDRVSAGQVLAELAGEDMQLERVRRENELRQHENAYKAALARSDRAQMVIHWARAGEAQAMLSLIDGQIERAQIRAPFDGLIIKGDLSQTLGSPVTRGDVLLTIAPGESFRIIVEVDEADIAGIAVGQPGKMALAASPEKPLEFTVRRIVPAATSGEARNYFEVEADLVAGGAALRPGLRGVAKIEAGRRSLLRILAERPLGWLRVWLWSAGL